MCVSVELHTRFIYLKRESEAFGTSFDLAYARIYRRRRTSPLSPQRRKFAALEFVFVHTHGECARVAI